VFANVVAGLIIEEPAADLSIAAAIASSHRDVPVRADVVLLGEVGLSGDLRWVSQMPTRLREASKLGFIAAVIPKRRNQNEKLPEGIKLYEARSLREALGYALVSIKKEQ
jgi:DNA repair protein RadA/Sms